MDLQLSNDVPVLMERRHTFIKRGPVFVDGEGNVVHLTLMFLRCPLYTERQNRFRNPACA